MKKPASNAPESGLSQMLRAWGPVALFCVALSVALAWGVAQLGDPRVMPVRVVGVDGEIHQLKRAALEEAVAHAVNSGFFSVDLERVRAEVERIPWVDSASVRRIWPDRLQVRVVEQIPLARWGKQALLNQRGEIFRPEVIPALPGLSLLVGPDDRARVISREYQKMRSLLATVDLGLTEVRVDARQAWRLTTQQGLELNLGRQSTMQRLSRFVQLYPRLIQQSQQRLVEVDLRYTNGFTANWETQPEMQVGRVEPADVGSSGRIAGI